MGVVLSRDVLADVVRERQRAGERAVFTNGVFDLLHLGHVRYLQEARALGDFLIVGLNSDVSTQRLKGPARPLVPEAERAEVLAALTCVDYVMVFGEITAAACLMALAPAVYAKGGDYAMDTQHDDHAARRVYTPDDLAREPRPGGLDVIAERLPELPQVAELGATLALLPYLPGHSTSALIARMRERIRG